MTLFNTGDKVIRQKNIAVFVLPLITSNGAVKSINTNIGNSLSHICGFSYKQKSIEKYLGELKYLSVSNEFINQNAKFWIDFWSKFNKSNELFACYYIDGNTKPIWSSKRCKKSKVTMLGRVMNCLEQAFVHDSFGHPIYFRTYSGNADLGNNALSLMEDIEDYLKSINSDGKVSRVMIIDSAGNGTAILKSIESSNRYFITVLNENQTSERKFKHIKDPVRYEYGNADLRECRIELNDSKEKNYIFECRGVIIDWDNGKQTSIVTNLPKKMMDASETAKSYFDRWPYQELEFKSMKSTVSIHKIAGYGKKLIEDEKMQEKQEKVKKRIDKLSSELKEVLDDIQDLEQQLVPLYKTERTLKENTTIEEGKRIGDAEILSELKECQKEINNTNKKIKEAKDPHKIELSKLQILKKEWGRIQGKDYVYKVDVELDQLMTCFRISFVNLCTFFISECLKENSISLKTLFHYYLMIEGQIKETKDERHVYLKMNKRAPKEMQILRRGLEKLNELNIINHMEKRYIFQLTE